MKRITLPSKFTLRAVAETLHRGLFSYMQRAGLVLSVAHTAAESYTDTTYSISASLPTSYDSTGYTATTGFVYTAIGRVSKWPEFGRSQNLNEFVPITGSVEYVKGAPRYGTGDVEMADMPTDAGQIILKAASESNNHYSVKITLPDGELRYLDVMVAAWKNSPASEGAINLRTATIGVCRAPVIVAAV